MQHTVPWLTLALIPAAALATACASSPARTADAGACELTAADSAFLAGGPLYRDCGVDRPAEMVRGSVDFSPPGNPRRDECFNAEVEFIVDRDGRPEHGTVRLVRTSHPPFADAVVSSVPGWSYTPAQRNGATVRQVVRERRVLAVRVVTTVTTTSGGAGAGRPPRPTTPPRGPDCR